MSLEITSKPRDLFSPWPVTNVGPGTDVDFNNSTVKLRSNMTAYEYMRLMYGNVNYAPVQENFNFLRRDSIDKQYTSISTDPFTMPSSLSGLKQKLKASVVNLLQPLQERWRYFGLPFKNDKDRALEIPDLEAGTSIILASLARDPNSVLPNKDAGTIVAAMPELCFVASNIAIILKTALPRVVRPGWWLVSYAGNNADVSKHLSSGLSIFSRILDHVLTKEKALWDKCVKKASDSLGDPLDTAVGYPYYTAEVDKMGNPVSKIKVIAKYKNLASGNSVLNAKQFKDAIIARGATEFERKWPLAIGCIRRIQQGNKEQHSWRPTAAGLKYSHDGRGFNTVRVAWAAPYILNLFLTPLQLNMKAFRMAVPGLYHDGEAKQEILRTIRTSGIIPLESDFSNYDRTIPVRLMGVIMDMIGKRMPNGDKHADLGRLAWENVPIVWPDHTSQGPTGIVFTPEFLALLSGLKITSEMGTLCTYVVMLETLVKSGLSPDAVFDQQVQLITDFKSKAGKTPPPVLIQSDDILFLEKDVTKLMKLTSAFKIVSSSLGMKAEVVVGDKFLMRHTIAGRDLPVISRWWQNSLASETPSLDPLIYTVGLFSRMDGMLGYKGVDPFNTGRKQGIASYQLPFLSAAVADYVRWLEHACIPIPSILQLMRSVAAELTTLASSAEKSNTLFSITRVNISEALRLRIEDERINAGQALAKRDLALLASQQGSDASRVEAFKYISALYNDRHSPASATVLDSLMAKSDLVRSLISTIARKEYQFAIFACKAVGVNPFQPMA